MRRPVLVAIALCLSLSFPVHADVEWTTKRKLDLGVKPLDSALSADGQKLFILAPGEVLVYSIPQGKVTSRIPVGKGFDRITFSPLDNSLMLTSSSKKALEVVQLEFIQDIDVSGLPFKGPENARVTIAVFSDYQ